MTHFQFTERASQVLVRAAEIISWGSPPHFKFYSEHERWLYLRTQTVSPTFFPLRYWPCHMMSGVWGTGVPKAPLPQFSASAEGCSHSVPKREWSSLGATHQLEAVDGGS